MGTLSHARVFFMAFGLMAALESAPRAEPAAVESAYFEATVSRGERIVARPSALVKLGADAKMGFESKDSEDPPLALAYRVDEKSASQLSATITALVGGKQVATQMVSFTRARGRSALLEGGGFSWRVSVDLMTPEFLKRRRARGSH